MKHLGDITRLNGAEIEPVDVITGGSPCQDLSLAGKQAGLSGERSGLFHEQMRLVREMREATGGVYPHFMVWENVPGALSTNKGADFREVLNECVKVVEEAAPFVPMPKKGGWPKAGVLYDEMGRWSIAWRIHDAQFWGVPQRRRRIALVCDFRGMRAPEVLFEREGVRGDTAPRGAAGQGAAGNPGGSAAKADAGRIAYQLVGVNSNSMKSSNPHSGCYETEAAGTITANGYEPNNQGGTCIVERRVYDARGNGNGSTAATVTGDHESRISDYTNVVVHATAYALNGDNHESGMSVIRERSHALRTTTKEQVCISEPVAFDKATIELRKPVVTTDGKAPTLIAKGPGGVVTYGIDDVRAGTQRPVVMEDCSPTLISHSAGGVCALEGNGSRPGHKGPGFSEPDAPMYTLNTVEQHAVCAPTYCVGNGQVRAATHITKELAQTLNCMHEPMQIATPREAGRYVVRRLTPLECTRLQGYPDGWVDIGEWKDTKGKTHKEADAPKYKALGNSIALPFWKWLLARIYAECESPAPLLGSLFDGIGGFPLSWPGRTAWSSEIEEFPLAVLRARFVDDDDVDDCCKQPSLPF